MLIFPGALKLHCYIGGNSLLPMAYNNVKQRTTQEETHLFPTNILDFKLLYGIILTIKDFVIGRTFKAIIAYTL